MFLVSRKTTSTKTQITKKCFLHPAHRLGHKPKSSLHRLRLRKYPIKKPRNIIQIGSDCQPDQTLLGSIKPNIMVLLSSLKPLFTAAIVIVLTPTGQELIPCVVKNYLDRLHQWKIFLYASTPSLN